MYLNPTGSPPWNKHIQSGCTNIIGLYYDELTKHTEGASHKTEEEIYLNVWYWKQTLNHQQLLKLISD